MLKQDVKFVEFLGRRQLVLFNQLFHFVWRADTDAIWAAAGPRDFEAQAYRFTKFGDSIIEAGLAVDAGDSKDQFVRHVELAIMLAAFDLVVVRCV